MRDVFTGERRQRSFEDAIDAELRFPKRQIDRERRLTADGHDPAHPPASTLRTDLITRRAFEQREADLDRLVDRMTSSSRSRKGYSYRAPPDRGGSSAGPRWRPFAVPVLPRDFYECTVDIDVDIVVMWSLYLSPSVEIRPDPDDTGGGADVAIDATWRETVMSGLRGRLLGEVIRHPALQDRRIRVLGSHRSGGWTILRVTDPIVPLA